MRDVVSKVLPVVLASILTLTGAFMMLGGYKEKVDKHEGEMQALSHEVLPGIESRLRAVENNMAAVAEGLRAHNDLHRKFNEDVTRIEALLRDTQKELSKLNARR